VNGKRHNLLLTGIATAISTLVAVLIILINTDLGTPTRVAISSVAALAVFGAFAVKFYRMRERVAPSNLVSQHCLILAAHTHGVLQDRANYWLSGKYGKVISSTMTATEKGFYLAIFYESIEIKELPLKEVK
jgi:hypothetical protein